ncbi:hypothetical protein ATANTOWER_032553 [Ataeniobius toweri]|uniref:Ribonuclease A-domain domain-containing protein n=1 Tax=Ataeniobius toweri TaxID=208326 RepID=A0ABU7C5E0_9TELE|nr:hypothetical protein [Ataeniobius toweri]
MSIFPVCLLVCLLLVQVVAPETTERSEQRFREFVRQHIIEAMEPNNCTTVMANRNIKHKDGPKDKNTFIIGNENEVTAICHGQIEPKKTPSKKTFDVVVCVHTIKEHYEGTKKYYQIIEVECANNLPVHFYKQRRRNG